MTAIDFARTDLAGIAESADRLERALAPIDLTGIVEALRQLESRLHIGRRREERVLYPALAERSALLAVAITALVREHQTEREYLQAAKGYLHVQAGDTINLVPLVEICRALIRSIRDLHRKKEQLIYRDAAPLLSEKDDRELIERMKRRSEDTEVLQRV